MINMSQEWMDKVKGILNEYVPSFEVRVFGSRVTGSVKPYSDLDLVIMNEKPIAVKTMALLKNAFEESELPIKVDVIDWLSISEKFQKVIEQRYEIIS